MSHAHSLPFSVNTPIVIRIPIAVGAIAIATATGIADVSANHAVGAVLQEPDVSATIVEVIVHVRLQLSHEFAVPEIDRDVGDDVPHDLIGSRPVGKFESR